MTFQVELIRILLEEQLLLVLRADAPTLGYAEVLLSVAIENQTKTTSLLEVYCWFLLIYFLLFFPVE